MPEIVWTPRVKDLTSQTSPNRSRSCCGQHSKYLGLLSHFKAIKAFQSENQSNAIPPSLIPLDGKITIIQISGVGLWQWRKICSKSDAFATFNGTLQNLGYSPLPAAKCRIAKCLYQSIQEFAKKMSSRLVGKAARDRLENNKVYELCIEEDEIGTMPKDEFEAKTRRTRDRNWWT